MAWIYIQMLPSLCGVYLTECTCWGYLLLYTWSVRISHRDYRIFLETSKKYGDSSRLAYPAWLTIDSMKIN